MQFNDHFSGHPEIYKRFRPVYPAALFQWLHDLAPDTQTVWDAGTGNGQAALALAERFPYVIATDPSAQQVALASPHPRVRYAVSPAEASGLDARSVDLCFSAQALHWFDFEAYWAEVRRVASPRGVVVAMTYNHPSVTPAIDAVVARYIAFILEDWPPQRRHVNAGYATIPFPFDAVGVPDFAMTRHDTFEAFYGYCGSWSAAQRAQRRLGHDPRLAFRDALLEAWGGDGATHMVHWPLRALAGRVAPPT